MIEEKKYIVALTSGGPGVAPVPLIPLSRGDSVTAKTFDLLADAVFEAERFNRDARRLGDISSNMSTAAIFERIEYSISKVPPPAPAPTPRPPDFNGYHGDGSRCPYTVACPFPHYLMPADTK